MFKSEAVSVSGKTAAEFKLLIRKEFRGTMPFARIAVVQLMERYPI